MNARETSTRVKVAVAVAAGRLAGSASRLAGKGGGTSLPGLVAQRIAPDIVTTLAAALPRGSIVVAGTNGKTTTAAMLSAVLRANELEPIHNSAGANLLRGVASSLLARAAPSGRLRVTPASIGLFEGDEAALGAIVAAVKPTVVVVTNLFRDQLDRYGELDAIAVRWRAAFAALPPTAALVLNADDPLVASLGEGAGRPVVYYGLDLPTGRFTTPPESADSVSCRRCGTLLAYQAVYYGHLGRYLCPRCGWGRPPIDVSGRAVTARGLDGALVEAAVASRVVNVDLRVPGLYNVYNALAALAAARALSLDLDRAATALTGVTPAFGRAEKLSVAGREVWLLLVKNPTGADEVLHLLHDAGGPLDLLVVLNDNAADGHDVSWIWDVAVEDVASLIGSASFSGTRGDDMALRFKYAGAAVDDAVVTRDPVAALDSALTRGDAARPLYVVATYTAMLALRRGLVARGIVRHYLDEE